MTPSSRAAARSGDDRAASDGNAGSSRRHAWLDRICRSKHVFWAAGFASFLEATIVPIPLELALIPLMIMRREDVWKLAAVVTVGCIAGALVGYGIGKFLYESIGEWLVSTMGWSGAMETFQARFASDGFWAVFSVGVTPIPFQIAMLVAGAAGYSLPMFLLASALARGIRYFGLALLVVWLGERAESVWNNHRAAVAIGILVVIAAVWIAAATM